MKKISPKSLAAVLAAAIREDADAIALKIVEQAKGNDIEYDKLVARYINGTMDENPVYLSQIADQLFEKTKDTEAFKELIVELEYRYGFDYNGKDEFPSLKSSNYRVSLEIKEKEKETDYCNISASGNSKNIYQAVSEFESNFEHKILNRNKKPNELIVESPIPTTPEPTTES